MEQLDEITGVGITSAQELIAEIGVDMSRFATAGHLVSWAKFAPIDRSSAGKSKGGSTGKGNPWLAATLQPPAPTPSSASATTVSPGAAAKDAQSSPLATPS